MVKILVVEDDPLLSRMYQIIFKNNQYDVELAVNGEEALEKVRQTRPALILLDIMMPKLNGLQLLERIKGDPDLKDIPVVVLTNLADNRDVEAALKLGAVRYIIKSEQRPKQVEEIVRGILAGYTRGDIPSSPGA